MWKNIAKGLVCMLAVAAYVTVGSAYDVQDSMNTQLKAPYASLELYVAGHGQEYKLLDALVKSGSFDSSPTGQLSTEHIVQIPSGEAGGVAYLVLSQFFDHATAQKVAQKRKKATQSFVTGSPITLDLGSVEHIVGDWGWESGNVRSIQPVAGRSVQELVSKKMSVSFLKIGYVGQAANVAFFPTGTSLNQVLAEAKADPNLAGATIFLDKTNNQYVVYSEFFRTPQAKTSKPATGQMAGLVLDHQPGVVVQNYESR
jgi:hypothetical protein